MSDHAATIMILFRDWEQTYRQAGDMSYEEEVAAGLFDRCRALESQMMPMRVATADELAAKLIVGTAYGDFVPSGKLIEEAKALVAAPVEHADAKLIELGRQFEQAKAEVRPLEAEKDRLGSLVEDTLTQEGLPSDFSPEAQTVRKRIARTVGYNSAYDAFTKKHNVAVRLMKAIHRERPTTIEGIAVKLAAISFDITDFDVSPNPNGGDVGERQVHRLCRQVQRLVKEQGGANV